MDSEDVVLELEALEFTYGDQLEVQKSDSNWTIKVHVSPRSDESYVCGCLCMTIDGSYPASPPKLRLTETKGTGDHHIQLLV